MDNKFARGAKPCPRHKLAAATPHRITSPVPPQVAYVPSKMSFWLNNSDGDCVTAEEAFNKDVSGVFILDSTVQAWAGQYGYLNGAELPDVMDQMAKAGFSQGGSVYGDGQYTSVDYSNESILQSALSIAPVKIGIDANALPSWAQGTVMAGIPSVAENKASRMRIIAWRLPVMVRPRGYSNN